jgi:hypothetical protein
MAAAEAIVWTLEAYAAVGITFGIAFVSFGIARVDSLAKNASVGFRLIVLPGAVTLWPFVLIRWISGCTEPTPERNAHRDRASLGDSE